MKTLLSTLLALSLLLSFNVGAEETVHYQSFPSDVQVIDVRTDAEWQEGHHPNALHMPHTAILDGQGYANLDKTKPVVLYCRSGGRAEQAKKHLIAEGFTNVTNAGGISDLVLPAKEQK